MGSMESFQEEINSLMKDKLNRVEIKKQNSKIIRESIFGINKFNGWEISLLDLPILQRLRNIHQNGLTFFTYPTAIHTRFDHTLGVTSIAGKYIDNIQLKSDFIKNIDKYHIRLASIFHDVGHGPFSHLSEEIYSQMEPIKSIKKEDIFTSGGSDSKPHEILSYFIVKSESIQEILKQIPGLYVDDFNGEKIDSNLIGQCIIGKVDDLEKKYYQDVINGTFDADKLDYILRDCYFSGLKMSIDIERIFYGLEIDEREEKPKGIISNISSVHNLEQLLFNKVILYPSIYHHHKVRCASCMFKSVIEIIHDFNLEIDRMNFQNVIDFLKVDDSFFQNYMNKPEILKKYLRKINNRVLLKRALVLSMKTIEGDDDLVKSGYEELLTWQEDVEKIQDFRIRLAEKVGISKYDVWLDIPKTSSTREASQHWVKIMKDNYEKFNELFPIDDWLKTYQQIQYKAHIFCPPIDYIRKKVAKEAKKLLQDEIGLSIKPYAEQLAKLPI
ncbi:MAG: HD domain-containing protein [Promethearchaeota archaeon]